MPNRHLVWQRLTHFDSLAVRVADQPPTPDRDADTQRTVTGVLYHVLRDCAYCNKEDRQEDSSLLFSINGLHKIEAFMMQVLNK